MSILHSLILGIVEGFTEFLPISSTAHLILTSYILGLSQSMFVKSFEIVIQGGAILAVVAIYWRKFLDIEILKKVIVAFIPTAIIGLLLYKIIKTYLIGDINLVLWTLLIGGILLIVFERYFFKNKIANIQDTKSLSYKQAAILGVAQAVAVIPGVSRSAATIVGGLFMGMNRSAIVEFSFLLAVPTILAATGLDLVKNIHSFSMDQAGSLTIGFIAAFVTAIIGIKFLLAYVKTNTFTGFGWYRIAIVLLFILIWWR